MPSNLMFADSSFPVIGEEDDPKQSIKKVMNYLYMLLEQLRYTLGNLEPGNFNEAEMTDYFKKLTADLVVANTVISNTVITNELYASYGSIADLTVDKLRTDYKRARKYLIGDKTAIDYIDIHDEVISFITATTDGTQTTQLTVGNRKFYWMDETHAQMTSEKDTGLPVTVYVYKEQVKAQFKFEGITLESGKKSVMPVMIWGAGTGNTSTSGKCFMYKAEDGMRIQYHKSDGSGTVNLDLTDAGAFMGAVSGGVRNVVEVKASEFDATVSYPLGTVVAVLED